MAKSSKKTSPRNNKKQPSLLNWMGTLLLYAIPGVNLVFLILSAIFARSSSKRTFAIAGILVFVLCALLIFLAFAIFPDFFTQLTDSMRNVVHPTPVGEVIPVA